jgi:hypothetical protein
MNEVFRLSRIRSPRATLGAALLLAAVFIAFGLLAYGLAPESAAVVRPLPFDGNALNVANWVLSRVGVR